MTTTPRLVKSLTPVNTSDAPVAPGRFASQFDGQIAALPDGGYVVVWTDQSGVHNPNGAAVVGQRYDSAGNKVGGEVYLSPSASENQFSPAVAVLPNGNIAVAFVDRFDIDLDSDIYVRVFDSGLNFIRTDVIDAGTNQTFDPALTAFGNGNYAVSYSVGSVTDTDIVGRIVTSSTGVVGGQFDIDNGTDNRDFSPARHAIQRQLRGGLSRRECRQRNRHRHLLRHIQQYRRAAVCPRRRPWWGVWRWGGNQARRCRTPRRRLCRGMDRRRSGHDRGSRVHHFQRQHPGRRQHCGQYHNDGSAEQRERGGAGRRRLPGHLGR